MRPFFFSLSVEHFMSHLKNVNNAQALFGIGQMNKTLTTPAIPSYTCKYGFCVAIQFESLIHSFMIHNFVLMKISINWSQSKSNWQIKKQRTDFRWFWLCKYLNRWSLDRMLWNFETKTLSILSKCRNKRISTLHWVWIPYRSLWSG